MHWQYTPWTLPFFIAAAMSAVLALLAWRRRSASGATLCVLLMLAAAVWALGYALEMGSVTLATKVFWDKAQYLGIVIMPGAWLALVLQYTGRERWLTRRNAIMLAVEPLVTLLLVWTNEAHHLIYSDIALDAKLLAGLDVTPGVWFWVNAAYSHLLTLFATLLLIRTLLRSSQPYRSQAGVLLICALAPWGAEVVCVSGLNPFPLDLAPLAFTVTGLVLFWGLLRFRLLDIVPVARDLITESMSDGLIVLDMQDRIVDINPAAQRIIGRTAAEAIGELAVKALANHPALVERFRHLAKGTVEIVLDEGAARRCFDLHISPLRDQRGRSTGRLVIFSDITERKRAENLVRIQRDAAMALGSTSDLREALNRLLDVSFQIEGIDGGGVYLVDPLSGELDLVAHKGLSLQFVEHTSHYDGDSFQARLVMAGRPAYGHYAQVIPTVDEIRQGEGLRALAVIPVQHEGQIVAALNLASHTHDDVSASARSAIEAMAARIGSVIARVRAEEALRESKEKYKSLFNGVPVGMYRTTPEGQILNANLAMAEMMGYPDREALLEANAVDSYAHTEDRRRWRALMERQEIVRDFDVRSRRQDGTTIWVRDSARAVRDDQGRVLY